MRKRISVFSANKLRREFKDFDAYALQEKFRTPNTSVVIKADTLNKSSDTAKKLSFVASAKKLETITPTGRKHKNILQSASVARLYAGEIIESEKKILTRKSEFDYSENEDFKNYLKGLKMCQDLQGELELNYDVSKHFEGKSTMSLGLFLQIDNDLKTCESANPSHFKTVDFLQVFKKFSSFLREILRSLKAKQCHEEAEMLEYLWRANVKLIDTAMIAQEVQMKAALDKIRENSRVSMEKCKDDMKKLEKNFEGINQKLNEELQQTHLRLKLAKKEFRVLQEKMNQKEGVMQELAEVDRFEILKNTKKALDDLTETLGKMTDERRFQIKLVSRLT